MLDILLTQCPFTTFIPHSVEALKAARLTLDVEDQKAAALHLLDLITEEDIASQPLTISSFCVSLLERAFWSEASQAVAHFLSVYPNDDWMICALSISLHSRDLRDEARVVMGRAIEVVSDKPEELFESKSVHFDELSLIGSWVDDERSEGFLNISERYAFYQLVRELISSDGLDRIERDDRDSVSFDAVLVDATLNVVEGRHHHDLEEATLDITGSLAQEYLSQLSMMEEEELGRESATINMGSMGMGFESQFDLSLDEDATYRDQKFEALLQEVDRLAEESEPEAERATEASTSKDQTSQYMAIIDHVEMHSPPSMAFNYPQQEVYSFKPDLLDELGLISDLEDDDHSTVIRTDDQDAQSAVSIPPAERALVQERQHLDDSTFRMNTRPNLDFDDISSVSDDEALLISDSELVSASELDSINIIFDDPLLYPPKVAESPRNLQVQSMPIPDISTTQWNKKEKQSPLEAVTTSPPDQNDVVDSIEDQQPTRSVTKEPSSPQQQRVQPSLPPRPTRPASTQAHQGQEQRSALQRLAEGELNLRERPAPLVASPPPPALHEPTPAQLDSSHWRAPVHSSEATQSFSWPLWITVLFCCYLALIGAFHHKSAHLALRARVRSMTLNPALYADLSDELRSSVYHPIGRSMDVLRILAPKSSIEQRRNEIAHHLAWVATSRWVLHGVSKERELAIEMIERSLRADQQRIEGRSALALALWSFGQTEAGRAVALALPDEEWRRGTLLGWMAYESGEETKAIQEFRSSIKLNSVNHYAAHLLSLLLVPHNPASVSPYLRQLSGAMGSPELSLYAPQSLPETESWSSAQRIKQLKQYPPLLKRQLLERGITTELVRDDLLGLQTIKENLQLNHTSDDALLLPALVISLAELNFVESEKLVEAINQAFIERSLPLEDWGKAYALWSSFTGGPPPKFTPTSPFTSELLERLTQAAGQGVRNLLKPQAIMEDETKILFEGLSMMMEGDWVGLERISDQRNKRRDGLSIITSKQRLTTIAKAYLNTNYEGIASLSQSIQKPATEMVEALLLNDRVVQYVLTAAYDSQAQGRHGLERIEQELKLPSSKWLSRFWRCYTLSKTMSFSPWRSSCEGAATLNQLDQASQQRLALALDELGQSTEALQLLKRVPISKLSSEGRRLGARLSPAGDPLQSQENIQPEDMEIMSAERDLRLSALTLLYQRATQRLSRQELYRGSWFAQGFGSSQLADQWRRLAIQQGSIIAALDEVRLTLLRTVSGSLQGTQAIEVSEQVRLEASVEPQLGHFISLFDAMVCLARSRALELHHFHPALLLSGPKSENAFQPLNRRPPPRECQQIYSDALSPLRSSTQPLIPLVVMAQVQLLLSTGQSEEAREALLSLMQREPSFIEARIAYLLLLFRENREPRYAELERIIEPFRDLSQGSSLPQGLQLRLNRLIPR